MAKQAKKVRIFSALEVANICGVVNQTAINWIKNGHLKAFTTPGGQYRIYAEDLLEFLSERGMRVPSEVTDIANREKKRLLIVDDEKDLNNMLCATFEENLPEFDVLQAFDGFEAGLMIAENAPAIIVLDINLPGVDGHGLIRKIREDETLKDTRIVAMSGVEKEKDEREKLLKEGADMFFAKPVKTEVMVEAITELIAQGPVRG